MTIWHASGLFYLCWFIASLLLSMYARNRGLVRFLNESCAGQAREVLERIRHQLENEPPASWST